MIDWDRVAELEAEIGAEDFAEVARFFVSEIGARLAQMAEAAPTAADLHFLRGCAANLGFTAFARACSRAEAQAKAGVAIDPAALSALFYASLQQAGGRFDAA